MSQTGHSIAQFLLDYPNESSKWNNSYLICLGVENEFFLNKILQSLILKKINVSEFYEPDINNELTSIAFIETEYTKIFTKKLKLLLKNEN